MSLARIDEWELCRGLNTDIGLSTYFKLSVEPAELDKLADLIMMVKYNF